MDNPRGLRQKRALVLDEARELLETAERQNRNLTTDEKRRWDDLMAQADNPLAEIERIEARDRLRAAQMVRGGGKPVHLGGQSYILAAEHRMADLPTAASASGARPDELSLSRWLRGIVTGDWSRAKAELEEMRAMSVGTPTAGGYLVPSPLSAQVIDMLRAKAVVMLAGAQTVAMEYHTLDLARVTGAPTAGWKAEDAAITASDMTLDKVTLHARTLVAMVKASVELMEDAQDDGQSIERALSAALALELDRVGLYGSGSGEEPRGIKNTQGTVTVSMGENGGQLTSYAKPVELIGALWAQNVTPNAAIYAPRTAATLEALTDTTGQPLQGPEAWRSLRRLVTSQVPANLTQGTANNASDILIGDFAQLLVGMRTNLTIEASRAGGDASGNAFGNLQVWVRAYLRADFAVEHANAFGVLSGIIPAA